MLRLLLLIALWLPLAATAQIAERVVSLAPNLTELAYAAGLGDKLVGVSAYSDFPPAAQKIEQVANWQGINVERILRLKPDLVLAWRGGNPQRPLDQLASLGVKVVYLDPQSVEQVADALDKLADYSREPENGHAAARQMRQRLQQLKAQHPEHAAVPVFIQFSTQPLFTSSGHTLQSQIVSLCGAENIFADSPAPWPQVSREQVLSRAPKAIIFPGTAQQQAEINHFWQGQLQVPLLAVNADWFNRAGPRILLAAQQLCSEIDALKR
ncbi:vitamin B12 ABC transporter substrate-binding protein BtuF [Rouxiella badensis]|uniref:vitamin B12 ABC transporter substrate-binding protein BtuF n=1 Tax=Rouxiella badensis TaxID=1646377 RepID=UPI0013EF15E6|nr:vitamin B12 ABC transporter substrate-binding protein BtuF [Rouxiella badensis]QII39564.1 vitamin B12 ABC transporter substrate-binding protein BtuF [Rouxiella badensis]